MVDSRQEEDFEMQGEFIGEIKRWVSEAVRKDAAGEPVGMERAVEFIRKQFAVHSHEVAILVTMPDQRFLRFVVPENLQIVGRIPLTSTGAVAARTVREKRAELINHFAVVPHSSVFEAVPIGEDARGVPIQKIMSVPIMLDKKVIGVIQISRKGATAAEAGPDFVPQQLRELKAIADTLAPCIPALCAKETSTQPAVEEAVTGKLPR
jgi:transcriptional regulator with GAF, ATPase, and Fis domain